MVKTTTIKDKSPAGLRVGTSGWIYGHWAGVFYPEDLKSTRDRLSYYARYFDTVEVNYSFYHLPRSETYQKWAEVVPSGFLFSLKASRFITHIRKLNEVEEAWNKFKENAMVLGDRLGPVLFQFPPNFKADVKRLSRFLELFKSGRPSTSLRPVFEFRHSSWFDLAIYAILQKAGASLCIAHSSKRPFVEEVTSGLIYYRFHGPEARFASNYSSQELRSWAKRIQPLVENGKSVFIYFNNDAKGYAVQNARALRDMISNL